MSKELENEQHMESALARLEAEVAHFNQQIDRIPEPYENGQDSK